MSKPEKETWEHRLELEGNPVFQALRLRHDALAESLRECVAALSASDYADTRTGNMAIRRARAALAAAEVREA